MKNKRNQPCLCLFGPLRLGLLQNVTSVALTKITVPRATVGVQKKVALHWLLALKHICLGTVAYPGTEQPQTLAVGEAALHSVSKGRVRVQTCVVSVLTQLNPIIATFNGVFSLWIQPRQTLPVFFHSLSLDHCFCRQIVVGRGS